MILRKNSHKANHVIHWRRRGLSAFRPSYLVRDATIGKIRKVSGKAFSPGFLQLLHLSFPRVVQQFRDVIVDMEFRVLQMFPGLIHHQFLISITSSLDFFFFFIFRWQRIFGSFWPVFAFAQHLKNHDINFPQWFRELGETRFTSTMLPVTVIHQTFAQLTAVSDLQIISNAFWNNRGQNSWGERGEIFFYLPLPGASVRTYGDVITKFSRMDSLLSLLRYGAPCSLARRFRY